MRTAKVKMHDIEAGLLSERDDKAYSFQYHPAYQGPAISLTMPIRTEAYMYDRFPAFFDGLLPEGVQLEGLLKIRKIDCYDYFSQLLATGADLVGAVSVFPIHE